jgi:hypothetical protein
MTADTAIVWMTERKKCFLHLILFIVFPWMITQLARNPERLNGLLTSIFIAAAS